MNIAVHISFYYNEERFQYLREVVSNINNYDDKTDIYIHTNKVFSANILGEYYNGKLEMVVHDLSQVHPWFLTWKHRDLMATQKNKYDIFMYIEDDILVPKEAISYWLNYKDNLIKNNLNLGFFRIEKDKKGDHYCTDNSTSPDGKIKQYLTKSINVDNQSFIINDQNPYCAFWIYDKNEFNKFLQSKFWNTPTAFHPGIREDSGFGMTNGYKDTVIPLINNKLNENSKIYHLPNNYVGDFSNGWKLHLFDDVVKI